MRISICVMIMVALLGSGCCAFLDSNDNELGPGGNGINVVQFTVDAPADYTEIAHPNEPVLLLVGASDVAGVQGAAGPVQISVTCPNATVTVEHAVILPGQFAEATITPNGEPYGEFSGGGVMFPASCGLPVTITGTRGLLVKSSTVTLTLFDATPWGGTDPAADAVRDQFIGWLAAQHPELGLTPQTQWSYIPDLTIGPVGSMPEHCWYLSADWALEIGYHWVEPPSDFANYYLRRRFSESENSLQFSVNSRAAVPFAPVEVPLGS
jgi:hypothetical protein